LCLKIIFKVIKGAFSKYIIWLFHHKKRRSSMNWFLKKAIVIPIPISQGNPGGEGFV